MEEIILKEDYKGLAAFAERMEIDIENTMLDGAELDLYGEPDERVTKLLVRAYDAVRNLRLYCEKHIND